jgi:hypothetical protein
VDTALELLRDDSTSPRIAINKIGSGKNAEEALAIAVFCASLHSEDFGNAIRLAANHDGDSDVTAALCGGIFGAYRGIGVIPKRWIKKIQYYNLIMDISEELFGVTVFRERRARRIRPVSAESPEDMTAEIELPELPAEAPKEKKE